LEGTIVATNRGIGRKDTCVDSIAEFVGVFEFAEIADAVNEVVEADEGTPKTPASAAMVCESPI
jgi:hypothetical protein